MNELQSENFDFIAIPPPVAPREGGINRAVRASTKHPFGAGFPSR